MKTLEEVLREKMIDYLSKYIRTNLDYSNMKLSEIALVVNYEEQKYRALGSVLLLSLKEFENQ